MRLSCKDLFVICWWPVEVAREPQFEKPFPKDVYLRPIRSVNVWAVVTKIEGSAPSSQKTDIEPEMWAYIPVGLY
jgi:hypothetical protein